MLDKMINRVFDEFKHWVKNNKPHARKISNDHKYLKSKAQMA